jgi:prevent-host-death family protein
MPKTVSASEVKARFGQIVKWTTDNKDEVIVKLYGEPTVVIMPYSEYEELEKLRKQEQKRKALESLEELRKEARRQNPEVVQETLLKDRELARENV